MSVKNKLLAFSQIFCSFVHCFAIVYIACTITGILCLQYLEFEFRSAEHQTHLLEQKIEEYKSLVMYLNDSHVERFR